jgi:glutamate:GABA antiporter
MESVGDRKLFGGIELMITRTQSDTSEQLRSQRIAGGILQMQVLNSFDMVAIFVAIVLYITNVAGLASAGPVSFLYLLLGFITFLIPGAIVTGQLGLMFPNEGSIYVWTHKAFGAFMGFFIGFCAWWPGLLVIIVAGTTVVALIKNLGVLFNTTLLANPWEQGVVILGVIAFSFVMSILRIRATQNLVNVIFISYGSAILLIGLAGAIWFLSGQKPYTDVSFASSGWSPNSSNFTIYGFVILALLGVEVPLNMGAELRNTKAITRYLLWGSIVVMVAYLIGTFAVMVAVPTSDQSNPASIVMAVRNAFGPAGAIMAVIVTCILIGFFLFSASVYNYSFGRLLFVSGLDRHLPTTISRVNANRVPWLAVLVQSIITGIIAFAIYVMLPLIITSVKPDDLATIIYYILNGALTVMWAISMIFLFIDVIVIRFKYRDAFAQVRLAPDWVFYLCSVLGLLANAVAFYVTFTAPWIPALIDEGPWVSWIIALCVLSLLAGIAVYFIGHRTVRTEVNDEQVKREALGQLVE